MTEEIEVVARERGLMLKPEFTDDLETAAAAIRNGGVVITPSEGVYGLSCSAFDENAINRIIRIKERDSGKGLITIAGSMDDLKDLVALDKVDAESKALMQRLWPGPYTFVLPCVDALKGTVLTGGRDSIAVRVSAFASVTELARLSGVPLVSTSANLSGMDAESDFSLISPVILRRVDVALTVPCGDLKGSTSVYDTLTHTLLRKGHKWPEDLK